MRLSWILVAALGWGTAGCVGTAGRPGGGAPDVGIDRVSCPGQVHEKDSVSCLVTLRSSDYEGPVTVAVEDAGGRRLTETESRVAAIGPPAQARLSWRAGDASGHALVVRLKPSGPDAEAANNSAPMTVETAGGKIRVLYLQEGPSWEYRYARQALEDDPAVEFYGLVQHERKEWVLEGAEGLPLTPQPAGATAPPISGETLEHVDVLILGDVAGTRFRDWDVSGWTHAFVRKRGGGLLLQNALPYDARLDDVRRRAERGRDRKGAKIHRAARQGGERMAARVTEVGARHPATSLEWNPVDNRTAWDSLGWISVGGLDPARCRGEVLLECAGNRREPEPRPLMIAAEEGRGRVLYVAIAETWRWRSPARRDADYHARFWSAAVRWLAGRTGKRGAVVAEPAEDAEGESGEDGE